MFAPVISRFNTYQVSLPVLSAQYAKKTLEDPPMLDWYRDAQSEPQVIETAEVVVTAASNTGD